MPAASVAGLGGAKLMGAADGAAGLASKLKATLGAGLTSLAVSLGAKLIGGVSVASAGGESAAGVASGLRRTGGVPTGVCGRLPKPARPERRGVTLRELARR